MITACEGRGVGAGKSYFVATQVINHVAIGGTVCASSSLKMKWPECKALAEKRFGVIVEDDQFRTFPKEDVPRLHEITPQGDDECPVLLIIDEAHIQLNARDWSDKSKRPFFEWLTQSRHDNNDVMFVSQACANMDKQIMRLVTYVYRVRNLATWAIPGIGKWPFKQFVITTLDGFDQKTVQSKKWIWHDKEIFNCYVSKSQQGTHQRSGEVVCKKKLRKSAARSKSWQGKAAWAACGVWAALLVF
jgi:hypothetical protein